MLKKQISNTARVITCPGQGQLIPPSLLQSLASVHKRSSIPIPESLATALFDPSTPNDFFLKTSNLQPSIVYTSLLLFKEFQLKGQLQDANYIVGHSLGELTALVLNGVIPLESAVEVAQKRGEYMEQAVDQTKDYGMTAFMFKDGGLETIENLVKESVWPSIGIANVNSSTQCVLSGEIKELEKFGEKLKESSKVKTIKLDVKLPFHNQVLKDAQERFRELMKSFNIEETRELHVPIISNLNAQITTTHGEALDNFIEDFTNPVLFCQSLQTLFNTENTFIFDNLGPNSKVIHGLVRKMDSKKQTQENNLWESL